VTIFLQLTIPAVGVLVSVRLLVLAMTGTIMPMVLMLESSCYVKKKYQAIGVEYLHVTHKTTQISVSTQTLRTGRRAFLFLRPSQEAGCTLVVPDNIPKTELRGVIEGAAS